MRHTFKLLAATVAAATICSCSTLTGYPTDAEASYAKAIEIAKKSVDTDKFKVYSLSFMEGETLSDNLFLISVKLVNRGQPGIFAVLLHDRARTDRPARRAAHVRGSRNTKPPSASTSRSSTPHKSPRRSHRPKPCLPEGHTFKSVGRYQIEEDVPAGNSVFNRNKTFGQQHTSFVVRFTEAARRPAARANVVYLLRGRGDRGTRRYAFDRRKLKFFARGARFSPDFS